ncbi:hypothetical protein BUALT_Bualt16G0031600 [Buddleja alternifolia]|uniref:Uncharacterized protein n=1 Tax=Buddleja alternifolia TaxID=168488 RepID=A0AAV6WJA0_9LAMI|nr:hypothetical protein BUALT_Bualt16G0031600 [Buddleja alternifolia]
MSTIYDNWERLVVATLRRELLWQLAHASSMSSRDSDFTLSSPLPDLPFHFLNSPSSLYHQNPNPEVGPSRWGYNYNDFEADKSDEAKLLLVPRDVFVNSKALNSRELNVLRSCLNPPKKLKPGHYWYDKYSGFWGKKGHRPSQIISANLDLEGYMESNASNGNTEAYINGREITKVELRVLKLAGVKCYRDMHFWLNEDGTYQEEAATPTKGSIWGKPGMKLLCSLFSLPFPSKSFHTSEELSVHDYFDERDIQKLRLIGCSGSETSTIFKQAIFLYKDVPFLEDELEYIKLLIQSNIYRYTRTLLEGHKQFEEENLTESRNSQSADAHRLTGYDDASDEESIYSFGPRLKAFSDWLLHTMPSASSDVFSASLIQASAPLVEELWSNPSFQETLNRRSELEGLPSVANYFLKRAVDIFKPDYKPSHTDILHAEGFPSSLSYVDFSFPPPHADEIDIWDPQDYMIRYQLIRATSNIIGDDYKSFESQDVRIIIFSISLTDYDQFVIDDNGDSINKMMFNKECFESMALNIFNQIPFLLLLTEYDLFVEKIRRTPLNQCDWFNDFNPIIGGYGDRIMGNLEEMGFYYISVKFKELYSSITGQKLYVAKVNCLEQDSVDAALKYARDILKWGKRSRSLHALSVKKKKKTLQSSLYRRRRLGNHHAVSCRMPEREDTPVTQR